MQLPSGVLDAIPRELKPQNCIEHPGGFSGARVFRLETRLGNFALRGWPVGFDRSRILSLHRLLNHIHELGATRIAAPLPWGSSTLARIRDREWQIEPWLSGEADSFGTPTQARLAAAVRALAEWHHAAAGFSPSADDRHFAGCVTGRSPNIENRINIAEDWFRNPPKRSRGDSLLSGIHGAVTDRLPRVIEELKAVKMTAVPLQPVLRDVWREHILFEGDIVSGIIDPAAAATDTVATDIARLLGSFLGEAKTSWEFAIAQYNHRRPLCDAERRLIVPLHHSGTVLAGVTWLRRATRDPRLPEHPAARARMENVLAAALAMPPCGLV